MSQSFVPGAVVGLAFFVATFTASAASANAASANAAHVVVLGRPHSTQRVELTIHLPLRDAAQLADLIRLQSDPESPLYRRFLSVAQFRASFGPTAATFARASAALRARGLTVTSQTSQGLRVSGAVASVERALGTRLAIVRDATSTRIARVAPAALPAELRAVGASLVGLETRIRLRSAAHLVPLNRLGPAGGYYFDDLKEAYSYPADGSLDGAGAVIGVLMSSDVLDSDTAAAFEHERYPEISGRRPPPLIRRVVLGGAPFGGIDDGASGEASVDVQTAQGSAPGAQLVLYEVPALSDDATLAGYTDAVEDNRVDVLSSSFEACELTYTSAYTGGIDDTVVLRAFDDIFKQGNAQGITFTVAAGDGAGKACPNLAYFTDSPNQAFIPSVSFPADDPNVTAVGGTNLQTTAPLTTQPGTRLRSDYVAENADADPEIAYDPYGFGSTVAGGAWGSGSGTSALWFKPWYQYLVNTPAVGHRIVPDIAMQMGGCPDDLAQLPCRPLDSSSIFFVDGVAYGFIGTSLSAPEFAGLLALRIGMTHARLGNVNGYIYELAAAQARRPAHGAPNYFHQGIAGNNGVVTTAAGVTGFNPIVGVGTPYARNFLEVSNLPLAGDPQTLSNP